MWPVALSVIYQVAGGVPLVVALFVFQQLSCGVVAGLKLLRYAQLVVGVGLRFPTPCGFVLGDEVLPGEVACGVERVVFLPGGSQ